MIRTIKDFRSLNQQYDNWGPSNTLVSQLFNDFGIPQDTVDFITYSQSEDTKECTILFSLSKSKSLGEVLKCLGKILSRLDTAYKFSILELNTTYPDKYYILIYGTK